MTARFVIPVLFCALILSSCGGGGGGSGSDGGTDQPGVSVSATSGSLDGAGRVTFLFPVNGSTASLQLIVESGSAVFRLSSLTDPTGRELQGQSSAATSQSVLPTGSPTSVNAPFLDGTLPAGNYRAVFEVAAGTPAASANLTIVQKADADLMNGTLRVNVVLYGPVGGSEDLREDFQGLVNKLEGIFSGAGITLDVATYEFAGSDTLPDPRSGAAEYQVIADAVRPYAVNVIFASRVLGLSAPDNRYGRSGATPGPSTSTSRSAIALSVLSLTGGDGDFTTDEDDDDQGTTQIHEDELRLAAEEAARLMGRYLGLENIVEFQGSRVTASDSLSDTESCLTVESCRDQGDARSNVMMPRPLQEESGGDNYYSRDSLTNQQRLVLNRHVLVN